jgi:hypothetical protein
MEPIRHTVTVAADPGSAFEVFTAHMGWWWDPAYSPDPAAFTGIAVEPWEKGEVVMLAGEDRHVFGTVTTWDPGRCYAQLFWLAMSPAYPSSIVVTFTEPPGTPGVCEVVFEHGGWGAENADDRQRYGDWPHLLGRFAAACAARD